MRNRKFFKNMYKQLCLFFLWWGRGGGGARSQTPITFGFGLKTSADWL